VIGNSQGTGMRSGLFLFFCLPELKRGVSLFRQRRKALFFPPKDMENSCIFYAIIPNKTGSFMQKYSQKQGASKGWYKTNTILYK